MTSDGPVPEPDRDFEELFRQHKARAFGLAFARTLNYADAEDAVQEAAVKVLVQWNEGRVLDFRSYFLKAVANQSTGVWRRRKAQRGLEQRMHSGHRAVTEDAYESDLDHVFVALSNLSEKQRQAVYLVGYLDTSEMEAAAILGISRGAISSHLHRARTALHQSIGGAEG